MRRREFVLGPAAAPLVVSAQNYFAACASYLRRGGRVLLDSPTKVDRVWTV